MEDFATKWLFDPTVGKLITSIVSIIIVISVVRVLQKVIVKKIKDTDARYRFRKSVSFFGYLLAIFALTIIFSDKLGGLTVAFGVAGAGIAFALQEVVASFAGWFFYGRPFRVFRPLLIDPLIRAHAGG